MNQDYLFQFFSPNKKIDWLLKKSSYEGIYPLLICTDDLFKN